jgi:hypothetical protein
MLYIPCTHTEKNIVSRCVFIVPTVKIEVERKRRKKVGQMGKVGLLQSRKTRKEIDVRSAPLSSTTNGNILGTLASDDDLLTLRCSGDDESAFAWNERRKFASGRRHHHAKASQGRTVMRVRVKENSGPGTYLCHYNKSSQFPLSQFRN